MSIFKNIFNNKKIKKTDYELLKSSPVDWSMYSDVYNIVNIDPITFFINNYIECPLVVNGWFDSKYYMEANPDIKQDGINPLVHFLRYGQHECRTAFSFETDQTNCSANNSIEDTDLETLLSLSSVEWSFVMKAMGAETKEETVASVVRMIEMGVSVIPGFYDDALYLDSYPDIRNAGINGLKHYINNGISEGRIGWLEESMFFEPGQQSYKKNKDVVIVVCHEESATGAPAVALQVARGLSKNYNVVTVALVPGPLHDAFLSASFLHVNRPAQFRLGSVKFILNKLLDQYHVSAAIHSSVETLPFLEGVTSCGIPSITLLHEFAEYSVPKGKISRAIFLSDLVVYPAECLKVSGLAELKRMYSIDVPPGNIWVQPQGALSFTTEFEDKLQGGDWSLRKDLGIESDALVIAGAGHLQPRKGVDWFFEAAYYLMLELRKKDRKSAENIHFVWLGSGYSEHDTQVSVWLDTFIDKSGIKDHCHFAGHVDDVQKAFKEVDVYILSSRLDPFPNVAIDALAADCGIAVFDGASGVAEFAINTDIRAVVAPYGDTHALAAALVKNLSWLAKKDGINCKICEEKLSFQKYLDSINLAITEVNRKKQAVDETINSSKFFNETFDPQFYSMEFSGGGKARHFLSLLYKGIVLAKPFSGSNLQEIIAKKSYDGNEKFIDYVEQVFSVENQELKPVVTLTGEKNQTFKGSIALHFHAFYRDLIPEYCHYFKFLKGYNVDIFVSYVESLSREDLDHLEESIDGKVFCLEVENSGRDVLPFNQIFVDSIYDNYDLVGHFHTKKSNEADGDIGSRWRSYLLSNLMGSYENVNQIFSLFEDSSIGLIYAEDRHCVNEGKNIQYIDKLLAHIGLEARSHYYSFPLGTMFWARTKALINLTHLDRTLFEIDEPVPYDGTMLHAFERIVPQLVEDCGYDSMRIYVDGTAW